MKSFQINKVRLYLCFIPMHYFLAITVTLHIETHSFMIMSGIPDE